MGLIVTPYKPVIITSSGKTPIRRTALKEISQQLRAEDPRLSDNEISATLTAVNARMSRGRSLALELAIAVLDGEFDSSMVEEKENCIRIKDPELYIALRKDMLGNNELRSEARLTLIADLARLGHRVGVMAYDPQVFDPLDADFSGRAKLAGVSEGDIIYFDLPEKYDYQFSMAFPRDLFVQIKDTVYICPEKAGPFTWKGFFGWAKGLKKDLSRIGIGGEVVIGDGYALLSEINPADSNAGLGMFAMNRLVEMVTIGESQHTLQQMGFEVFRIPTGWTDLFPPQVLDELGTTKRFVLPCAHADLSVLVLPYERGLYFSAPYYEENRAVLDPVVDKIRPNYFGVLPDEDGLPVNSLPLPGGGVYMDSAARQSIDILRRDGIRVETTSKPYGSWAWGVQAGIHCCTNQVNLISVE